MPRRGAGGEPVAGGSRRSDHVPSDPPTALALLLLVALPDVRRGLASADQMASYCACNRAMSLLEPGDAAVLVAELAGDGLRAVGDDGRLRPVAETAWGAAPAGWGGAELVLDCHRPEDLGGRRGVTRSWTVRLDADGRVLGVEQELWGWTDCPPPLEGGPGRAAKGRARR